MTSIEQAIIANPDDEEAVIVLADHLERDHGELVIVQRDLARAPTPQLIAREQELRAPIEAELASHGVRELAWHLGFIRRLYVNVSYFDTEEHEAVEHVRALLTHAATRFTTDLTIQMGWWMGDEVIGEALVEHAPTALRSLSLHEFYEDSGSTDDAATSKLWAKLPYLEHVKLASERGLFKSITHARVTTMDLEVAPFGVGDFEWQLPALQRLAWDPHIESDIDVMDLWPLWKQPLPALRELVLRGLMINTATPLFERPEVRTFIKPLERLEIPCGAIGDPDEIADHILANAQHLEHLSSLVLSNAHYLEDLGEVDALRARLPQLVVRRRS